MVPAKLEIYLEIYIKLDVCFNPNPGVVSKRIKGLNEKKKKKNDNRRVLDENMGELSHNIGVVTVSLIRTQIWK